MVSPTFGNPPLEKPVSEALTELALDLRWSFNHAADQLWARLDPELWELTHNPWIVLQTISQEKLQSVAADTDFRTLVAKLLLRVPLRPVAHVTLNDRGEIVEI